MTAWDWLGIGLGVTAWVIALAALAWAVRQELKEARGE